MKKNMPQKKDYSYDFIVHNELLGIYNRYLDDASKKDREPGKVRYSFKDRIKSFIPASLRPFGKIIYRFFRYHLWNIPQVIIILPLYYISFIVFSVKSKINFHLKIDGYNNDSFEKRAFDILFQKWGGFPMTFIYKFEEAILFMKEDVTSPSMEIGCQRGEHSEIIFKDKEIDFACEYSPSTITSFVDEADAIFKNKVCADTYAIPFSASCMNTIFLINSIDDFQRGAEDAIAEYARIIKPGGKLVFSGFTRYFKENSIFSKIKKSGELFEKIYLGIHNFLDKEEWESLLGKYDLELKNFVYLVTGKPAMKMREIALVLERKLINKLGFSFAFALFTKAPLLQYAYKRLIFLLCIQNMSGQYKDKERGALFFAIACKKTGRDSESGSGNPFIVCPYCRGELLSQLLKDEEGIGRLLCKECHTVYPVIKGVPILHPEFFEFQNSQNFPIIR